MDPLLLAAVRRRRMTPLILLLGRYFRLYFRIDGPYSSGSPQAVVAVSMSPRVQACLKVVGGDAKLSRCGSLGPVLIDFIHVE